MDVHYTELLPPAPSEHPHASVFLSVIQLLHFFQVYRLCNSIFVLICIFCMIVVLLVGTLEAKVTKLTEGSE